MDNSFLITTVALWVAVVVYAAATVTNTYGLIFDKHKPERAGYRIALSGLFIHGSALIYWWVAVGHGPYMSRFEVLSSNGWMMMAIFLLFVRFFPQIRTASLVAFPASFLLIALGLFSNPGIKRLPPSLRSFWLVMHVCFYKISLATLLIAFAFSIFYILKQRRSFTWLGRLPDTQIMDLYSYRFAGFGFTFWAIGMLAGSIWAYQSWGRFWGWDPVETWSLITWIYLAIYLHLRRFFGWNGERAAYFFIVGFLISLVAVFFVPLIDVSIHAEYFK